MPPSLEHQRSKPHQTKRSFESLVVRGSPNARDETGSGILDGVVFRANFQDQKGSLSLLTEVILSNPAVRTVEDPLVCPPTCDPSLAVSVSGL